MSYEIRITIPEDSESGHLIASMAAERDVTPSEVVETLIDQAAHKLVAESHRRIPGLPSEPMTEAEAAEIDEAMAIVISARRERSERMFGA